MTKEEKKAKIDFIINEIEEAKKTIAVKIATLEMQKQKYELGKSRSQQLNCAYKRFQKIIWFKPNLMLKLSDTLYKVIDYILTFEDKKYITPNDKKRIIIRLCEIWNNEYSSYCKVYYDQMSVFVDGLAHNLIYFRKYEDYKWKVGKANPVNLKYHLYDDLVWYKEESIHISFDMFSFDGNDLLSK